jgi:Holliday junction resolvase
MRFDRAGWKFLKPEELGRNSGKNFFVSKDLCEEKGITFEQLIATRKSSGKV